MPIDPASTSLLEQGALGAIVVVLGRVLYGWVRALRRRNAKLERFARHEIAKGDVGDETLALLDETDPD